VRFPPGHHWTSAGSQTAWVRLLHRVPERLAAVDPPDPGPMGVRAPYLRGIFSPALPGCFFPRFEQTVGFTVPALAAQPRGAVLRAHLSESLRAKLLDDEVDPMLAGGEVDREQVDDHGAAPPAPARFAAMISAAAATLASRQTIFPFSPRQRRSARAHGPQQCRNFPPGANHLGRIAAVLERIPCYLWERPEIFLRAAGIGRSASRATGTGSLSSSAPHIGC
jgi:hypothetical protein